MWIPFECDLCHFCNVTGRGPIPVNTKDDSTLLCIQQASLDGMWRGKTSTASGNLRRVQKVYPDSMEVFNNKKLISAIGTNEVRDRLWMGITLTALNAYLSMENILIWFSGTQWGRLQCGGPMHSKLEKIMGKEQYTPVMTRRCMSHQPQQPAGGFQGLC